MRFRTKHHRKPTSIGGSNDPRNISMVNGKMHEAWHTLFKNKTAPEIIEMINKFWIDPDFYIECIPKDQLGGNYD